MAEIPKQRWRFELGRSSRDCKIFVNDEQWFTIMSLKIEANSGKPTLLTLEIMPHEVMVDIDPSLQEEVEHGLFGARRNTGDR